MRLFLKSISLLLGVIALLICELVTGAVASEYSLSVLPSEDAAAASQDANSSYKPKAIVEDVGFDVPDVVRDLDGVKFRVMRDSTELFVGSLDDLKAGELTFGVMDSQLILGTNVLEVEFFVPPSPEVIARSHMKIELGERKGLLRRIVPGRRGLVLGASGAAVAGLAALGLRRYLHPIPVQRNVVAAHVPQRLSLAAVQPSVAVATPQVAATPSPEAAATIRATEEKQPPPQPPSAKKNVAPPGTNKKPFRRSGSWLQAPTTGLDFSALKHGVRNVNVGVGGKIAVSAVGAAVVGQIVSGVFHTVSNALETRRINSLSPGERVQYNIQSLIERIRIFLSNLR